MDGLAPELLDLLASSLRNEDVPKFRPASRAFAMAGIRYLRIAKHFYFRKHSLDRLRSIAQHPTLSRNLEEIVFFVDVVPDFDSQHAWADRAFVGSYTQSEDEIMAAKRDAMYLHSIPLSLDGVYYDYDELKQSGWLSYQEIRHEQKELLEAKDTFESLRHTLGTLHCYLKSFSISLLRYDKDSILMRGLSMVSVEHVRYCYNDCRDLASSELVAVQALQAVLVRQQSRLTELRIININWTYFSLAIFDSSLCTATLGNLQTVQPCRSDHGTYSRTMRFLQQVLRQTIKLEHLGMNVQFWPMTGIQAILKNCRWSGLARLMLRGVDIDLPSFQSFLLTHAKCLKELHLADTNLLGIDEVQYPWTQFLKFMVHNLNLSELILKGQLIVDYGHGGLRDNWEYQLRSGRLISVEDTARFLVCGRYPDLTELTDQERQDISSLTWQDIDDAHE